MAENIIMPQLGESIAEGTIVKWLKQPGDAVKKDENIVIISTDKVEAEIPSPKEGVLLDIAVAPGETVAVGTVLGQVGEEGEKVSQKKVEPKEEKTTEEKEVKKTKVADPEPEVESESKENTESQSDNNQDDGDMSGFLSPLVRRIAKEHGVSESEISSIDGSGRGGRVSKKDILNYIENKPSSNTEAVKKSSTQEENISVRGSEQPISTMRKVIMENMILSRKTSAHVSTFFDIDYTAIDKVRAKYKEKFKQDEGVSLTYTTFLAAAVCQVLKRHPYINASIDKDKIIFKKDIHLGMAVAIESPEPGLMVPVIKNADKQNLRGLAHSIADLSSRVRARKIKPDELSGGTFTITNPGNYGAIIGTPIINQPQVAILGVGNIKKQAVVCEVDGVDVIAIKRMGILCLSFDHRLIDGATADIFMKDLKETLEAWESAP